MWIISNLDKQVTYLGYILVKTCILIVLYSFKNYHTCSNFFNSSEKLRETDFDRQIKVITFLGETPRNFTEKQRGISRRRFCLPGLFRGVSPRNKNFALAMVAEKRKICCFFFTGSIYGFTTED